MCYSYLDAGVLTFLAIQFSLSVYFTYIVLMQLQHKMPVLKHWDIEIHSCQILESK